MICRMDSGSMTDCRPICDREAEFVVRYRNGSYPAHDVAVCSGHVRAMEGRAFPGLISTARIMAGERHTVPVGRPLGRLE